MSRDFRIQKSPRLSYRKAGRRTNRLCFPDELSCFRIAKCLQSHYEIVAIGKTTCKFHDVIGSIAFTLIDDRLVFDTYEFTKLVACHHMRFIEAMLQTSYDILARFLIEAAQRIVGTNFEIVFDKILASR